jgi:hypothetical protein
MKNGFQTQNNNVNPTAEQIKRRNKLHKEATKQADKSFSAACKAPNHFERVCGTAKAVPFQSIDV